MIKPIFVKKIDKKVHDKNCECVLCGEIKQIQYEQGKHLYGLYVCEDCLDYIAKLEEDITPA